MRVNGIAEVIDATGKLKHNGPIEIMHGSSLEKTTVRKVVESATPLTIQTQSFINNAWRDYKNRSRK